MERFWRDRCDAATAEHQPPDELPGESPDEQMGANSIEEEAFDRELEIERELQMA